jgi:hypothetical protein
METMSVQVILKSNAVQNAAFVVDVLRASGFTVGALVANNFSLTGPVSVFETHFGIVHVSDARAGTESALPLSALPPAAQTAIEAIVVPRRPDFGPRSF